MDLFEALQRRRTCRKFRLDDIPDSILERLTYAANRAPSGGNVNTKVILLVKDQTIIQRLRMLSPGFESNPPLILVICTRLSVPQDRSISIIDIGAAAENVALAATSLGLGVGFVKSFPQAAVSALLHLPDDIAPDLIITLGYSASKQEKSSKAQLTEIYRDSYGNISPKTQSSRKFSIDYLFEIVLFMLACARMCIDEPSRYGPKRLMDSLRRVLAIPRFVRGVSEDKFLAEVLSILEQRVDLQPSSVVYTDQFKSFLDELLTKFANELEKRSAMNLNVN